MVYISSWVESVHPAALGRGGSPLLCFRVRQLPPIPRTIAQSFPGSKCIVEANVFCTRPERAVVVFSTAVSSSQAVDIMTGISSDKVTRTWSQWWLFKMTHYNITLRTCIKLEKNYRNYLGDCMSDVKTYPLMSESPRWIKLMVNPVLAR